MKRLSFLFFVVLFLNFALLTTFLSTHTSAQESVETLPEIVVTATRIESTLEKIPSSVTVITKKEIDKLQAIDVSELLRTVQGLDVVQSGGAGKTTSVLIRGGNSEHTLVLIDGVQVNSPTLGSYDFSALTIDNIERIEIVRGPQSTLYGSDAMAGVINIITRKGRGAMKMEMSAEGGSYGNSRFSASSFGKTGKIDYSFGVSRFNTDGVSAARDGTEDDGYGNTTLSGLVGVNPLQNLYLEVGIRQNEAKSELDSFGTDDPNYVEESKSLLYFAKASHNVNEKWEHALKFSINDTSYDYKDPDTSWNNSEIDTRIENVDWQHNFYLSDESNILTAGIEYEKQWGENKGFFNEYIDNRAFYLQDQANFVSRRLGLVAGMRLDDHSRFGKETTYRLAGSYLFSESLTRLKGSWGTGFKSPTLNNLFYQDPYGSRGNPNLKPEKSIGYDIAIEQDIIEKRLMLSATYFHMDFDNLIQWVEYAAWSYEPRNVSKAETDGWEFGLNSNLPEDFQLNASWTITNTRDKITDKELVRRPRDKAGISASWNPKDGNLTVSYNYIGKRWDDTNNTKGLEPYTKIDVSGAYHMTKVIKLFGRIENLTDENYEEVKGYGVLRRGYYAGIKAEF